MSGSSRWVSVFVLGSLLFVSACGSNPVMPVIGTVTRNGMPVPHLFINFVPDEGRPSWASSDTEGKFVLHYDAKEEGAMVGMHSVTVEVKPQSPKEEIDMMAGKVKQSPEIRAILNKYGRGKPNPLRFEIRRDTPMIELKLD